MLKNGSRAPEIPRQKKNYTRYAERGGGGGGVCCRRNVQGRPLVILRKYPKILLLSLVAGARRFLPRSTASKKKSSPVGDIPPETQVAGRRTLATATEWRGSPHAVAGAPPASRLGSGYGSAPPLTHSISIILRPDPCVSLCLVDSLSVRLVASVCLP